MGLSKPTQESADRSDEVSDGVLRALGGLSEKNREAVSLYYVNGYSVKEISGFLDVSPSAIKERLRTAREQLREQLMDMVKDEFERHNLPDDFTDKVISGHIAQFRTRDALRACYALREIGESSIDALVRALEDRDHRVRRWAVRTLEAFIDTASIKKAIPALAKALDDTNRKVRERTFVVLGSIAEQRKDEHLIELLLKKCEDPNKYVRWTAIESFCLVSSFREKAFPYLVAATLDKEEYVRKRAVWALNLLFDTKEGREVWRNRVEREALWGGKPPKVRLAPET